MRETLLIWAVWALIIGLLAGTLVAPWPVVRVSCAFGLGAFGLLIVAINIYAVASSIRTGRFTSPVPFVGGLFLIPVAATVYPALPAEWPRWVVFTPIAVDPGGLGLLWTWPVHLALRALGHRGLG